MQKSVEVTNFQTTFANCTSLISIPADLFKYNIKATNFYITFGSCSSLTGSIPKDLFKTNTLVTDFSNTFNGCIGITSALPELWLKHPITATHLNTFTGCTQATNLQDAIDNGWAN